MVSSIVTEHYLKLVILSIIKWFQVLLPNTNNSI